MMKDPHGIPDPRHPYAVFLLSLCLTAGVAQVVRGHASGAVADAIPPWLALGWGVLLVTGALVSVTGIFWRSPLSGLMIEGVGQVMFSPAALAYAAVVFFAAGEQGLLAATPYVGFAIAAYVRLRQIRKTLRSIQSWLDSLPQGGHDA